jgi:hypothetical protein
MKTYKVINLETENQEIHEYTITVYMNNNGHEVTVLSRSLSDTWSEHNRGEELIKIIDTGDMVVFPKKEFSGDVGYDKQAELYILLHFMSKTSHMPFYKGRIEEITPTRTIEI